MEFEHTQRSQEELEEQEALKKKKLEELKANLKEFHPARIGWHATRIIREKNVLLSPDDPRGPDRIVDIVSDLGYGALLLTALALEKEK